MSPHERECFELMRSREGTEVTISAARDSLRLQAHLKRFNDKHRATHPDVAKDDAEIAEITARSQAKLERILRNLAVLDHPDVPHERDPETDEVIFDDDHEAWFRLKYL